MKKQAPIAAILGGMLKFAGRDELRESRGSRRVGGARRDVDHPPEALPARSAEPSADLAAREQRRRKYRVILRQLRAHTTNRRYRRLLTRRLFRGESIAAIARSLGLTEVNARTVVSKYLGLKS